MPKVETFITPVGTIKFPKTLIGEKESGFLHVPSITEGTKCAWKFQLVIDPKEAKSIIAMLDEQHKAIKGANFKPYKPDQSRDEDGTYTETGLIAINFTTGFPPVFIDCATPPAKVDNINVGWGSKVRVKFSVKPVNNKGKVGLGRYCKIIQIVELADLGMDTSDFGAIDGFAMEKSIKTAKDLTEKKVVSPEDIDFSE
jgi:hypothetical protein